MATKDSALSRLARMRKLGLCQYVPNRNPNTGESRALEFHLDKHQIRVLFGGNRTGKTESHGFEAVCAVMGESLAEYLPYMTPEGRLVAEKWMAIGSRDIWIGSVSYELQPDGCQEKVLRYLPKDQIKSIAYLNKVKNIISQINLANGRNITFKSYEQGRESFQSAGKGLIWFDEEPPMDIWKECSVRVEAGITLYRTLSMTPVNGMTWVYPEIYLNKAENPDIAKWIVGWDDNPHLTEDQKRQMAAGLSDHELKVRREGSFVQKQGLVYPIFNAGTHTVPADWEPTAGRHTIYRAVDFGFAIDHPFVCLWIAVDTDGSAVVYDEYYATETGHEEIRQSILEKTHPFKPRGTWADSARPDYIDWYTRNGIPMEMAKKDVELGVSAVTQWLTPHAMTGAPRLMVSQRCHGLIQQLENYVYPKKSSEMDQGKRLPDKKDDDGPDALRYFVMSYSDRGNQRHGEAITYREGDSITGYGARLGMAQAQEVSRGYRPKYRTDYRLPKKRY